MTITRRALLTGLAVTPAAVALGAAVRPSPAAAATYLPASDFTLHYRDTTTLGTKAAYASTISALAARLPAATVDAVLDSANRTGGSHSLNYPGFAQGWVWESGDNTTTDWYPQGLTTSADYHDDGVYNGRRVILVSWYDHSDPAAGKGVRVSFVDMSTPSAPTYRHVLLVEPYHDSAGNPNFAAVHVHAGGLMWYGDLLYVVDTSHGIRVFDTTKIMQVTANGDKATIGRQPDGSYTAHNYLYVLPQSLAYDSVVSGGYPAVQWSCISLDRTTTPDSIVVGEYGDPGDGKRIFRWDLDYTTRLLKATGGVATSTLAAIVSIDQVQGVTSVDNRYYFSRSQGNDDSNILTWVPGNTVHSNAAPPHSEDVSYDHNTGWLWDHTEEPSARWVYALSVSTLT